jgi:hypothetical protein
VCRHYYDPGRARSAAQSAKGLSRSTTIANDKTGPEQTAYETSAKQFGILTLDNMSGSTDHKLRRTVGDMQEILKRWERIVSGEGIIDPQYLDAESQQDLMRLADTGSFEPVLRLMPDMFAKFYKCLELVKQWWVLAHEIYPELPIYRPPTPKASSTHLSPRDAKEREEGTDGDQTPDVEHADAEAVSELVPVTQRLHQIEADIALKEDLLLTLGDEMQVLGERERHFESLVEAYEKVTKVWGL